MSEFKRKMFHSVNWVLGDNNTNLSLEDFKKKLDESAECLRKDGYGNLYVGMDDLGNWAEDGQTIAVFGEKLETDEEYNARVEQSRIRSERAKIAYAKRRQVPK